MKRGRPRDDYSVDEFLTTARLKMDALGITKTALAGRSLVNRGTVSRIFSRGCPASREVRLAIMDTLAFAPELRPKFSGVDPSPRQGPKPMLISDYGYPLQPALVAATTLLHEGFYYGAARELKRVFSDAVNSGDIILQADAAGRAALVYLEIGDFNEAERWAQRSIAKCSEYIGLPVPEIVRTAPRFSPQGPPSGAALASRILSDTLHNRCQMLVRQMLYSANHQLEHLAGVRLDSSLALDRRLDLSQPAGNDLRCKAVMEVTGKSPNLQSALRLIDDCKENFAHGGLFEAHLVKTRGIVYLQTGKPAQGRDSLIKAEEMLSSFPDARGLALTMYLASDAILRSSGNRRQALRHIVGAAALHPYGVVIEQCRHQARYVNRRDLQAEIDGLIAGKENYRSVHQMMGWLADNSSYTAGDLLFRNIDLMLAGGFPQVEIPARSAVTPDTRVQIAEAS